MSSITMESSTYLSSIVEGLSDPNLIMDRSPSSDSDPATPDFHPQTIKMEDLEAGSSSSAPSTSFLTVPTDGMSSTEKKLPKKRKSWGQVLPEPKTSLPPRKRAKTADEKEQRRIERVKRNRLAAHHSRERKRLETEALQDRNSELEERLRQLEEELSTYRRMFPDVQVTQTNKSPSAMSNTLHTNPLQASFQQTSSISAPPEPTPVQVSVSALMSPASFRSSIDSYDSPLTSYTEEPSTPRQTLFGAATSDKTQQSAALLCDLQCQSDLAASPKTQRWFRLVMGLSYFLLNLQMCMMAITSTLSSIFHSSQTAAMMTFLAQRASKLVRPNLHGRRLATRSTLTSILMCLSSSICTPAQAQQLLLATSLALRQRRTITYSPSSGAATLPANWSAGLGRAWTELVHRRRLLRKHRPSTNGMALEVKQLCRRLSLESSGRNLNRKNIRRR